MSLTHLRVLAAAVVLCVAALAYGVGGSGAAPTRAEAATISPQAALDWNVIAVNTVRSATLTPAKFQIEGLIYMSYVQAAVYNAVNAIGGRYTPYRALALRVPGASPRAAVASAAYSTLAYYFPTLAPSLATTYNDYLNVTLAMLPEASKLAGIAVGAATAYQLIASRWGDGRDAPVSTPFGVAPQPPGTWVFAPPPSLQSAQTPWVAFMKPFLLDRPDQFRAPAPPALTSPEYAAQLNEVKALGSATSSTRTAEQTAIGQFWNANVINQYNQAFRDAAVGHGFDLADTARLLAMGNMVGADAGIACMDSKYHYLLWRPITAIRNADKDGNPATTVDPAWTPLLTTPNHPEYPAAHGCVTSAIAEVFQNALKTANVDIDIPGATGGGTTLTTSRHFKTLDDLRSQIVDARIYAGLHYRGSGLAGVELGRQVGQWTLQRYFLPARK